jgi:hypothetical protein
MRRVIGSFTLLPILLLAIAPAALAARPSSGFTGSWVAIDPLDGSNLGADISGDTTTQIVYTDDNATNACEGASTAVFTSLLIGTVDGDEMFTTMAVAKCGTQPLGFHGLQIEWTFHANGPGSADDTLTNSFGEEYTRAD